MANTGVRDEIVEMTRSFVNNEVMPVVAELERTDTYPDELIKQMAAMGMFGMLIDEEHGGLDLDIGTYWRVVAELCRGWMSLGGALNSHTITAYLIRRYGTQDQKDRYLPRMATGELRSALAMTEAEAGSDVAAIRTTAVLDGNEYVVNGSKMFITNGEKSGLVSLLVKTDPSATPAHRGMSFLLAEKGPGLSIGRHIEKLGYNGIETVPLTIENLRVPATNLLGGDPGRGFYQAMSGSEIGRINVAARAVGVARAALDQATQYALVRKTFGKPIAEHQAVQFLIAEMCTKIAAAEGLLDRAAQAFEKGERADKEAGMAKLFATEITLQVVTDAMRIHGGYGYTKEFAVERLYRDAPQMVIAEGTNEIQRIIIARNHFAQVTARGFR